MGFIPMIGYDELKEWNLLQNCACDAGAYRIYKIQLLEGPKFHVLKLLEQDRIC